MKYKEAYLKAIEKEILLRKDYLDTSTLQTIYFGGGTPTQLLISDFKQIFDSIQENFDISKCKEITLEANPDDMTSGYISSLKILPFNRISMGIQSFDPNDLRFLNRRHSVSQAINAVEECKKQGYSNISIDLIYGLPGQTADKWSTNLDKVLQLNIPHISAYHLTYEEGTALHRLLEKGEVESAEEETSLSLFSMLIDRLTEAGYIHYEISNFALPGYLSLHNSSYWKGEKYLGLGPSAHSYNKENREWNVSSFPLYLKGIKRGILQTEKEILDIHTRYNDYIITRLRTMWGISYQEISNLFGEKYFQFCKKQAESFLSNGNLLEKEGNLHLSRSGIFISDTVMRELLWI